MVQMQQHKEYERYDGARVTQNRSCDEVGVWTGSDGVPRGDNGKSLFGDMPYNLVGEWTKREDLSS